MTNQPTRDNDAALELSADKPRKPYQSPQLILLETGEIEGGDLYLQEADGTGFVS
jgi:hypothetical protein